MKNSWEDSAKKVVQLFIHITVLYSTRCTLVQLFIHITVLYSTRCTLVQLFIHITVLYSTSCTLVQLFIHITVLYSTSCTLVQLFIHITVLYSKSCTLMCLSIGTLKTINFPFVPNGKLMVLSVPIIKHIKVVMAHAPRYFFNGFWSDFRINIVSVIKVSISNLQV